MKNVYESPTVEKTVMTADVITASGLDGTTTGKIENVPSYDTGDKW